MPKLDAHIHPICMYTLYTLALYTATTLVLSLVTLFDNVCIDKAYSPCFILHWYAHTSLMYAYTHCVL